MLNDMNVEVSQKEQKKFYEYQNHILPLLVFWKLLYI